LPQEELGGERHGPTLTCFDETGTILA
jgi:hypothetical protein